jgi:hypothetical protein
VSPRLLAQLGAFLDALVEERVDQALAARGVVAVEYRSSAPGPGVSRRTHNRVCRSGVVVGAFRDGAEWACSAQAWRAARAGGPARKPSLHLVTSDVEDVDQLLQSAGLRRTR